MVQPNTALASGPGFASIRVCTSKRQQFTYQYVRTECPAYTTSTDYYRAITPPATPAIISSSAVGHEMAELKLASPAASDSPTAYYLVKNLSTGVETQVSPSALARLYISGLLPITGYSFSITAVSVDGTATNSSTSQVIVTTAVPVVVVQSSDATLSSLNVTTATLSPAFYSATTSYSSTVSNGTTSATLTPTVNESHATTTVNGAVVTSGSASNAISLSVGANTIATVVTAQDGSTKTYSVVITRSSATDTTISAFSFLSPVVTGVVDNTAHTVALTVPYGSSKSALISTFSIGIGATAKIGAIAQVSGTTANDFTSPVTYTFTAQDGTTTQDYVVTVTVAIQAPAFTLSASSETRTVSTPATGFTVNSTGGAIASFGISPSTPAGMSFSTSTGVFSGTPSVVAGATTYTVTATNASGTATQTFAFAVTEHVYAVGDTGPGGGIVFYYSVGGFTETGAACASSCHYLEWAPNTWSGGIADPVLAWSSDASNSSGATGVAIGTGFANTTAMLTSSGSYTKDTSGAAFSVHAYTGGGKTDWFLPSLGELSAMSVYYINYGTGGFESTWYWPSTEGSATQAYDRLFSVLSQSVNVKSGGLRVRPIRTF